MYFFIKCLVSGILVALISEVGRRHSMAGAVIASLPITSILALVWLYQDTKNVEKVVALSNGVALIVLPSLIFFILLSLFMAKLNFGFYLSLGLACLGMTVTYSLYAWLLVKMGVSL